MATAATPQVGALPWRRKAGSIEILLITSRETKRWVIPKGWPMAHLIASNAAKREAYEEAGIDGCIQRQAIGRYAYDKRIRNGSNQPCIVTVYALRVLRAHRTWPEKAERKRCWFKLTDAAEMVNEPDLRALIRSFGSGWDHAGTAKIPARARSL